MARASYVASARAMAHILTNWPGFAPPPWPTFAPPLTPITIFGNGQQTRSFCYVDDLVEGFLRMMETDSSVTGPINLGNPGEFTIRELAEKTIS